MVECSRGVVQFVCLIALCFVGIPIWIEAPIRVPPALVEKQFRNFIVRYNKSYGNGEHPTEYQKRLGIFTDSLNHIAELNAKRAKDVHNNSHQFSAKYGVTPYSDLTENEFLSLHLSKPIALRTKMNQSTDDGSNGPATITTNDGRPLTDYEKYNYVYADKKRVEHALPDKIDWRDKNYVPSVRKQGLCGACWAYSIISNIESQLAIQNVTQASLSIQQMIDCAKDGNTGCSGGNACDLLEWLTANKVKIETESEYPMLEEGSGDCKADPNPKEFYQIVDFKCFSLPKSEDELLHLLVNHGPVTVAVNAMPWQHYLGGIIQEKCDGDVASLNHAVVIVGYDRTGPIPYYTVLNSWGSEFGNSGYLDIAYGSNMCGIANQVAVVSV